MPYWPARAWHNGNITLFNALNSNGGNFGQEKEPAENLGDRLLRVLNLTDPNILEPEERRIFQCIERDKPWLLTSREIALLEKLQATKK